MTGSHKDPIDEKFTDSFSSIWPCARIGTVGKSHFQNELKENVATLTTLPEFCFFWQENRTSRVWSKSKVPLCLLHHTSNKLSSLTSASSGRICVCMSLFIHLIISIFCLFIYFRFFRWGMWGLFRFKVILIFGL